MAGRRKGRIFLLRGLSDSDFKKRRPGKVLGAVCSVVAASQEARSFSIGVSIPGVTVRRFFFFFYTIGSAVGLFSDKVARRRAGRTAEALALREWTAYDITNFREPAYLQPPWHWVKLARLLHTLMNLDWRLKTKI